MRQNDEKCDAWISGFRFRLRDRMEDLEIDRKTLATIIGVDRNLIGYWLNGKAIPTAYHAMKLARALAMSTDDLIMHNF